MNAHPDAVGTIAIVNPSDVLKGVRGGATGLIANILPHLQQYRVLYFGIGKNDTRPWQSFPLHQHAAFIPICSLTYPTRIPMRLKVLLYYLRHRKKILDSGADILYIHMPECCLPFLYGNHGIPVIYHQHGSANPVALSRFSYARGKFFRALFEIMLKRIYRRADWIIAIDRLCYEKAIRNGAGGKTTLLMNAIDTAAFNPNDEDRRAYRRRYGIGGHQQAILFVGRMTKTKGPLRLLQCIPLLLAKGISFHLFFAGEGSYFPAVKRYVREHHFEQNVTFLGAVPHETLPCLYNMADVLVLPSDMEGVPMVVLEALACGTPVVASKVGGIPDIVVDGTNGYLVEDLTPANFAHAIARALSLRRDRAFIAGTVARFSASAFLRALSRIIQTVRHRPQTLPLTGQLDH